jgi:hypothetical protein
MEPSSTIGHNAAIGKDTTTPCTERSRGDNTNCNTRQGELYSHAPNDHNGSGDYIEIHGVMEKFEFFMAQIATKALYELQAIVM